MLSSEPGQEIKEQGLCEIVTEQKKTVHLDSGVATKNPGKAAIEPEKVAGRDERLSPKGGESE